MEVPGKFPFSIHSPSIPDSNTTIPFVLVFENDEDRNRVFSEWVSNKQYEVTKRYVPDFKAQEIIIEGYGYFAEKLLTLSEAEDVMRAWFGEEFPYEKDQFFEHVKDLYEAKISQGEVPQLEQ